MFIIDWSVISQRLARSRLVRRHQGHLKGKPWVGERRYRATQSEVNVSWVGSELKVGEKLATVCRVGDVQLKRKKTHLTLEIIITAWPTKVWGSVPNYMTTMPSSVRGGDRPKHGKTTPATTPSQQQWGTIVEIMVIPSIRTLREC